MAAEMNDFELDEFVNGIRSLLDYEPAENEMAGVVTKTDSNGVKWVRLAGSPADTPAKSSAVTTKTGDLVQCRIENNVCTIVRNLSSSSVTVSLLGKAMTAMVSGDTGKLSTEYGNFDDLKALNASIENFSASMASVKYLKANYIDAEAIKATYMTAETIRANYMLAETIEATYASLAYLQTYYITASQIAAQYLSAQTANIQYLQADFGNLNAATANMIKVRDLFAKTGLFEGVTVLGDGTLTGTLNATLLNGDTARFSNIYADAIKILGEDGLYRALNLRGLDTGEQQILIDEYGESLEGGIHGSHILAESITADKINVTQLATVLLLAQYMQVGATGGVHIESVGNRLSFLIGGYSLSTAVDDQGNPYMSYVAVTPSGNENPQQSGWYELESGEYVRSADTIVDSLKTYYRLVSTFPSDKAVNGEVAFISVNELDGSSVFYMTNEIVLKNLRFGKWVWFDRNSVLNPTNTNMALKWVG